MTESTARHAISGTAKAAILLVLLGEETASQIYRHLAQPDLEQLTQTIADLHRIDPQTALNVLEEYHRMAMTQDYVQQGGTEYAQKLLVKAFGEDGARQLLKQVSQAAEMSAGKLDSLQKSDPQQLAKFLEVEHPQTIALILAHLDAKPACALLMKLPENLRAESVKRMAQLRMFSPEIAQKVSLALHERLAALGEQHRRAYEGFQGVADLLNGMDPNQTKVILEAIEKDDPKVALNIRNLMFTFQDLIGVPESGIREWLGQLDKKTLAMALRGAGEDLKTYIFKSMSSRAVEMLKEDMEVLGPVRSRDVNQAQQEAVAVARKLEAEGKISLGGDEDEYVV
jgi:flagellar motor switch protein FliG